MKNKQIIYRVSATSIVVNTILSLLKLICGIIGRSQAMISDAVHSASDVFSTFIVIIGAKFSNKGYDNNHPYGHERIECVFSTILAIILGFTGLFIGYNGIISIIHKRYDLPIPGIIALCAAVISIIVKEWMYQYTIKQAKKIKSTSLKADAHHHRSDALSSIGSLIGILGAKIGFPIMDSIASIIICIFILKASLDIFIDAMNQMVDKSCDDDTIKQYKKDILKVRGVITIDLIKTRLFGTKIYVDIEIGVDANMSLIEAHDISEKVHNKLEKKYSDIKHCMVHVNPYLKK